MCSHLINCSKNTTRDKILSVFMRPIIGALMENLCTHVYTFDSFKLQFNYDEAVFLGVLHHFSVCKYLISTWKYTSNNYRPVWKLKIMCRNQSIGDKTNQKYSKSVIKSIFWKEVVKWNFSVVWISFFLFYFYLNLFFSILTFFRITKMMNNDAAQLNAIVINVMVPDNAALPTGMFAVIGLRE